MKLPCEVWSQLGAVNVRPQQGMIDDKDATEAAFGKWNAVKREITLDPSACPATQLATLFHEMAHIALWDSGLENVLQDANIEAICDAMGAYLSGAMLAGYISLRVPK